MGIDIHVLVVDDDPGDLELTCRLLAATERMQLESDTAQCLQSAIRLLNGKTYDVLLLDLNLQGSRGIGTLDAIRSEDKDVPVVVLSGLNDEDTALRSLDLGAQDYLVKGQVTTNTLVKSIRFAIHRHELQREIIRAHKSLSMKNQRLAELYETAHRFVDNVSHEFRTPLTVIKEYVSIIRDGVVGEVPEEQKYMLDVVSDRADDLNNMVDDMLDISKIEAGMLGVYRNNCEVAEALNHIRPTLMKKSSVKNVEIEFNVPADLPEVYCDNEKLGRVIVNLTTNAIKFSGDPGKVVVAAEANTCNREVLISVTDNGPGISEDNLSAIFERFKQVGSNPRGSTKGFGLGLNIAKELVDLNYGEISVKSEPARGSTFSFTIPFADPVEVVRRYVAKNLHLNNGSSRASLLMVRADESCRMDDAHEVDGFLNLVLRHNDLVFRIDNRQWLVVLAAARSLVPRIMERVETARREANENRPGGSLSQLEMEIVSTWNIKENANGLLAQVEQVMQIPEMSLCLKRKPCS